jgi:hypothetical protein
MREGLARLLAWSTVFKAARNSEILSQRVADQVVGRFRHQRLARIVFHAPPPCRFPA